MSDKWNSPTDVPVSAKNTEYDANNNNAPMDIVNVGVREGEEGDWLILMAPGGSSSEDAVWSVYRRTSHGPLTTTHREPIAEGLTYDEAVRQAQEAFYNQGQS